MNDTKYKFKENLRHISIRKKTASRICSTQVLYGASYSNCDIDKFIKSYMVNYLPSILKELDIKDLDYDLLNTIIKGVCNNILKIDEIISNKLSKNWSIDRLSETEKSVLRLATYELLFEKKFKKLTIINEYISIIEVFGGSPDFANGILENISKEINEN
ncbi:MAG: transcription antitermination factor NusB [Alphaproteobacteria bacterium TMED199]|nr:MAG: transcription antitermination factor NusB [Alphaproteobacteria bacterium TMED199]|tara:strand:- start:9212 stop:9691 length:480 start_codon:yes stop_codon:yes gene_type:complete